MQRADIHIFLSPKLSARLGKGGRANVSKKIKETAERSIKGLPPRQIEVVPVFTVNPLLKGYKAEGILSFALYEGVIPDLIQGIIKDAFISKFLEVAGYPSEARLIYGNIFDLYE